MDMHATIHDYENDSAYDVKLEHARQFVTEHAADIEKVERSTGWTGPHLRFPEKFTVTVRVAFPMHTLLVSFEGRGVNVERGARRIGNTNFDNWPLKYQVESEQADAFYRAVLAERDGAAHTQTEAAETALDDQFAGLGHFIAAARKHGFLPPEPPDVEDD